jgi:hypothetical protein
MACIKRKVRRRTKKRVRIIIPKRFSIYHTIAHPGKIIEPVPIVELFEN